MTRNNTDARLEDVLDTVQMDVRGASTLSNFKIIFALSIIVLSMWKMNAHNALIIILWFKVNAIGKTLIVLSMMLTSNVVNA